MRHETRQLRTGGAVQRKVAYSWRCRVVRVTRWRYRHGLNRATKLSRAFAHPLGTGAFPLRIAGNHAVIVRHGPNIGLTPPFCSPPAARLLTVRVSNRR